MRFQSPEDQSIHRAGEWIPGFALDPGFVSNQWLYLYYSPKDYIGQRLSRFRMQRTRWIWRARSSAGIRGAAPGMLPPCRLRRVRPDANLYISTGIIPIRRESDGYAPIDERPNHNPLDAQKSAANTHDLRGKILRIRPTLEGGYTIPDGNLFPKDGSQVGRRFT